MFKTVQAQLIAILIVYYQWDHCATLDHGIAESQLARGWGGNQRVLKGSLGLDSKPERLEERGSKRQLLSANLLGKVYLADNAWKVTEGGYPSFVTTANVWIPLLNKGMKMFVGQNHRYQNSPRLAGVILKGEET